MALDPITEAIGFAGKIIDKIFPDKTEAEKAKLRMFELQQTGELTKEQHDFELTLEQIKVNAVEAASASRFVAGWRPFIGWVSGLSLAWNYIVFPFYSYSAQWISPQAPKMFLLDNAELMALLVGILGLGAFRSYDKKQSSGGQNA